MSRQLIGMVRHFYKKFFYSPVSQNAVQPGKVWLSSTLYPLPALQAGVVGDVLNIRGQLYLVSRFDECGLHQILSVQHSTV